MASKEATARIKINKLLEAAGWRFFPQDGKSANIRLEPSGQVYPGQQAVFPVPRNHPIPVESHQERLQPLPLLNVHGHRKDPSGLETFLPPVFVP
jgi:hypothetical protein